MDLKKLISIGGILLSFLVCSLTFAEVPWKKFSYFQNWGGLNDQLSEIEIKDNESSDLQNVVFDTGGAIRKRYGYLTIPRDPLEKASTGSVVCITGLAFFKQNDGSKYVVTITNNDDKATAMKKDYEV